MKAFKNIFSKTKAVQFYIHIGLPKTGTSSIQQACYKNFKFLKRRGILYPKTGLLGFAQHMLVGPFMNEFERNRTSLEEADKLKQFDYYLSDINKQLNTIDTDDKKVVISTERFAALSRIESIQKISSELKSFDTKIIIWIKRQDYLLESLLAQNLRILNEKPVELMARNPLMDIKTIIQSWENIFGHKSIYVRHYNPKLGDILVTEFLNLLGISDQSGFLFPERANKRLSRDALHYLNHECNLKYNTTKYYQFIRYVLGPYSEKFPTPEEYKHFTSPSFRLNLLDQYSADNKQIGKTYFDDENILLNDLPKESDLWEPYPGLTEVNKAQINNFIQNI